MTIATAPAGPWTAVTCITAACSRCGAIPEDEDLGYTPHFKDPAHARERLTGEDGYGWRIASGPDGHEQLLCQSCAASDDCARLGHKPWTSPAARMADGRVLGQATWCDRCGQLLSHEPPAPAPPGYPAPAPASLSLHWDAAALPGGQDIAAAAARLLTRMSDDADAARWDAWDGTQAGRPARRTRPDPEADKAAALALIRAAHQLLCAAAGASPAAAAAAAQKQTAQ